MSDDLFERYKHALRRGHVAAPAAGRLERGGRGLSRGDRPRAGPRPAVHRPRAASSSGSDRRPRPWRVLDRADGARPVATSPRGEAGRTLLIAASRRVDAADGAGSAGRDPGRAGPPGRRCDVTREALDLAESRERRRWPGGLRQAASAATTGRRVRPALGRRPRPGLVARSRHRARPGMADLHRQLRTCSRRPSGRGGRRRSTMARPDARAPRGVGGPARRGPARCRPRHLLPGARGRPGRPGHPPRPDRTCTSTGAGGRGRGQGPPARPAGRPDRRRGDARAARGPRGRAAARTSRDWCARCA